MMLKFLLTLIWFVVDVSASTRSETFQAAVEVDGQISLNLTEVSVIACGWR